MLVLLCVQVVQINNNESSWREKKKQFTQAKDTQTCQESKNI
jgi:hypothetical protein